ncbi:MAG: hypothetical protein IKN38_03280 [Clostridia bacterium]|nr:hypothetical protein [Clostridia bacterium]
MAFRYYEGQLAAEEAAAYRAMRRALLARERTFSVPWLGTARLGDIYSMVKLDDPNVFGIDKLAFKYTSASSNAVVAPAYLMKKAEYTETLAIVQKRVKKIMAKTEGMDKLRKELYIHDYIVENVRYDKLKKAYSHEVTGPLCHGIGVCEGMAKTFKLLCDEAGIDSLVCCGVGVPPDEATGKKSERHAWNIVYIEGEAFGVDVTFDNTLSANGRIRYDYFNVPDSFMSRDHGNLDFPAPECKSEWNRRIGGKTFKTNKGDAT